MTDRPTPCTPSALSVSPTQSPRAVRHLLLSVPPLVYGPPTSAAKELQGRCTASQVCPAQLHPSSLPPVRVRAELPTLGAAKACPPSSDRLNVGRLPGSRRYMERWWSRRSARAPRVMWVREYNPLWICARVRMPRTPGDNELWGAFSLNYGHHLWFRSRESLRLCTRSCCTNTVPSIRDIAAVYRTALQSFQLVLVHTLDIAVHERTPSSSLHSGRRRHDPHRPTTVPVPPNSQSQLPPRSFV
ncbi:hypothetical protein BD413DRAFT_177677 [Trametes elegans]|nr:hypothetical protein BD413DRAFT_177677 [Trametes elegans]